MGKIVALLDSSLQLWILIRSKKISRIQNLILTLLLVGSCCASLFLFTAVVVTNSSAILPSFPRRSPKETISCDFAHFRTSTCRITGDVRVSGADSTVALITTARNSSEEKLIGKIRPYTRKWEQSMKKIREVSMVSRRHPDATMKCDVRHSVPAVVFSTGGYTGNVFHDFTDGLVPLFITSQRYSGRVVFMVLAFKSWWPRKYAQILQQMSHYPIMDFDNSHQVHCFPEVIVGLSIHGDLVVNSSAMQDKKSILHFQALLGRAFGKNPVPGSGHEPVVRRRPRLVLMVRNETRVIINSNEVLELASRIGFEVGTLTPSFRMRMADIYHALNSADVLVGVHGAGLTHFLFMRPNTTFVQIVPLGLDREAWSCFGNAAVGAGMRYVGYKVLPGESTLSEKYGHNHTVVVNPKEIASKGWQELKKYYLDEQDIRISLSRFEPILREAFRNAAADAAAGARS